MGSWAIPECRDRPNRKPKPKEIRPGSSGLHAEYEMGIFSRLSPRSLALLALGSAAMIALIVTAWMWSATPNYGVLFTNVSDRDGGDIIAQLAQMNVPYRTTEGGTIMVPEDKVNEIRLKLASQGLPKGSVVGFELLDAPKFGLTQFQEQVDYQRALEGELARSIQSLSPVSAARVHLAIPKTSGFLRDRDPPTASVLLQLRGGDTLDRAQIAGIVHLVASSVPDLNPKNVSVVDQYGNLLSTQAEGVNGLDPTQLDYVSQIEAATSKRILDILEPIVGPGNVRAQVTADVDFSNVDTMDETYAPNGNPANATIRSQTTDSSVEPGPATPQGIPGALSNQPPAPPQAPINNPASPPQQPGAGGAGGAGAPAAGAAANPAAPQPSVHKQQTTNYEVNRDVRRVHDGVGRILRLTAAVVINDHMAPESLSPSAKGKGKGKAAPANQSLRTISVPWSAVDIQKFQALAEQAMGYNQQRGDKINVVNVAFQQPEMEPIAPPSLLQRPDVLNIVKEGGKALLFLALTGIVVFGVLRPALKMIAETPTPAPAALEAAAMAAEPAALAAPASHTATTLEGLRQIAKSDPAAVANVVKSWVGDNNK